MGSAPPPPRDKLWIRPLALKEVKICAKNLTSCDLFIYFITKIVHGVQT